MGLLLADPGGEHYFSLGITAPGVWSSSTGAFLTNSAPAGRSTTYAIQISGSGNNVTKTLTTGYTTLIMGAAIYISANWLNATATPILQLLDSNSIQCDLRINTIGQLIFTRNGTQVGSASTNQVVNGSGWHYFEATFTIDGSVGAGQAWVDGISWLTISGQNTKATANSTANQVRFYQGTSGQPNSYWKDMYVLDTASGANTTRLGDINVAVIFPNGVGVNQQWTNNGGASQTASVQDGINHTGTWPDGDTSYISDSTTNHISDFAHQALSLTGTIYGVIHQSYMRKDDAGTRNAAQVCLSAGVTEVGTTIALGNTYNYYSDVLEKDPNTNAQWTLSGYNAATFGVKEIS
jgi:hypothetical protein